MSIDFATLQGLSIPEGVVTKIEDASGRVLWQTSGKKAVLEVILRTYTTYVGKTPYEDEEFILLNIYPKTNGVVRVTYGGVTKTVTDTSGADEPSQQQVAFGKFNGVTHSENPPASGTLTIEGDFYAWGAGTFVKDQYNIISGYCECINKVIDFGPVTMLPIAAFGLTLTKILALGDVVIPDTVVTINASAFRQTNMTSVVIGAGVRLICRNSFFEQVYSQSTYVPVLKTITMRSTTPPELEEGYDIFACPVLEKIIVPKGCGETYRTTGRWVEYAHYIVEEA